MTAEQYYSQARRLDQKINWDLKEIAELRSMARSVSSPGWGERISTSGPKEPGFVRSIEKIMELEAAIDREIDLLVDLKEQMREVINALPSQEEQLVIRYRFLYGYTWDRIGQEFNADARTARRRYESALSHTVLPEFPIEI